MFRLTIFLLLFGFTLRTPLYAQEESLYRNEDLQIQLSVSPEEYELRSDPASFAFGWKGALCEVSSKDSMVGGVLLHFPAAMKAQKYVQWREKSWKASPSVKTFDRVAETEWKKEIGYWLIVEHVMEYEDYDYHYLTLYLAHKRHNFELVLWVSDTIWAEYKEVLYGILKSVEYGTLPEATPVEKEPLPQKETIPQPEGKVDREITPEGVSSEKPELYLNREHGFKLLVPPSWDVRNAEFEFELDGSLLEFEKGEQMAGALGFHEGNILVKDYAEAFVTGVKESNKLFEDLGTTLTKTGGILRQCRGKREQTLIRYSLFFYSSAGKNYYLAFWMAEEHWTLYEPSLISLFNSFVFPTKAGIEKKVSLKQNPEPSYPWKGCKAGSWAEYLTVTEEGEVRERMGVRYVLLESGQGFYRMRTDMRVSEGWIEGEPVRIELSLSPRGRNEGELKPERMLVKVAAGEFLCESIRNDKGEVWVNNEIPFRLVKSLSILGEKRTLMTLVGFEKK